MWTLADFVSVIYSRAKEDGAHGQVLEARGEGAGPSHREEEEEEGLEGQEEHAVGQADRGLKKEADTIARELQLNSLVLFYLGFGVVQKTTCFQEMIFDFSTQVLSTNPQ